MATAQEFGRICKISDDYVSEIVSAKKRMGNRVLTASEKDSHLKTILADKSGRMQRIGQQMVGPIQLKLRYQGLSRNVLLEYKLEPGVPMMFDILDDLGQAYQLHSNEGAVKITQFEGKRMTAVPFRIATYP